MSSRIPEDSVLRRHYFAEATGAVMATMPPRPTDSVLRRHFDASVQRALAQALGSAPSSTSSAASSASTAAPVAAPAEASPSEQGGGFFGWLKRLFGG